MYPYHLFIDNQYIIYKYIYVDLDKYQKDHYRFSIVVFFP